ncbi:LOW QUALITY PROTEIN: hypothetical protein MAR_037793 [Mya arenaria]|uniref:Uncharacterized protein n=1 Tax=Mya arenaria TaxID=6604 RepID=A0ABY7FTF4_MYAAR|nr:LOW QUALITY PROTEIN: hypothetical protein MAR_037793 [Mya arenaria]
MTLVNADHNGSTFAALATVPIRRYGVPVASETASSPTMPDGVKKTVYITKTGTAPTPSLMKKAFALKTLLMEPFLEAENVKECILYTDQQLYTLLTTLKQNPRTVASIVLACVFLHISMRVRFVHEHNGLVDEEDNNHQLGSQPVRDEFKQNVVAVTTRRRRGDSEA